jgi:hypothetical protein
MTAGDDAIAECDARVARYIAALDNSLTAAEADQVKAQLRRAWLAWRAYSPQAAVDWLIVAERVQREAEIAVARRRVEGLG